MHAVFMLVAYAGLRLLRLPPLTLRLRADIVYASRFLLLFAVTSFATLVVAATMISTTFQRFIASSNSLIGFRPLIILIWRYDTIRRRHRYAHATPI